MRKGLVVIAFAGLAMGAAYGQDVTQTPATTGADAGGPAQYGTAPIVAGSDDSSGTLGGEHDYIAVLLTDIYADKDRNTTRHGLGGSFIVGHLFNDYLSLEVNPTFSLYEAGKNKGTDFYEYGGTVDLSYAFLGRFHNTVNPYILAGVGGDEEQVLPDARKKGAFVSDAGAGFVTVPLIFGIALRGEARYQYTFFQEFRGEGYHDIRGSLGIEIPLGLVEHTVVAAPEPVQVVTTKEVPRPWVDSDGDGVDDEHDKCPNTPHGLKVDSDGCVIPGQVIVLRGITFEFNKSRVQPNAEAILDNMLPAFTGQANLRVEIAGHTDSIGSAAYNQQLSQRRAEAIRNYLISKGALPEQVRAVGYGKSQLLVNPEKNDEDRELNRRVEFRVVDK